MARGAVYRYLAPHRQKKHEAWLAAGNKELSYMDLMNDPDRQVFMDFIQKRLSEGLVKRLDALILGEDYGK